MVIFNISKFKFFLIILILFIGSLFILLDLEEKPNNFIVLGDYDWELRDDQGHIDNDRMIAKLKNASVNTYLYLILHEPSDFEDLPEFLAAAQEAEIDIWIYLAAPSNSDIGYYSLPFELDFIKWAEELAKLSLEYPILKAMVIDDFNYDLDYFTPDYVAEIRETIDSINPNFKFMVTLYYTSINRRFLRSYAYNIDGVIFPYRGWPSITFDEWETEKQQINHINYILSPPHTNTFRMSFPKDTVSKTGSYIKIEQNVSINIDDIMKIDSYLLSFMIYDEYISIENTSAKGYHIKQVLIDDNVVWEDDVIGDEGLLFVELDISKYIKPFINSSKYTFNLTLRLIENKSVSNFPISVWWSNLSINNITVLNSNFTGEGGWDIYASDDSWQSNYEVFENYNIPLYVMLYVGDPGGSLFNQPFPSLDYIKNTLDIAYEAISEHKAAGIITYCMYKGDPGEKYDYYEEYVLISDLYANYTSDNLNN